MGMIDGDITEIAVLADEKFNKYEPGQQCLHLLSMTGLQELSRKIETTNINASSFLMNKDLTPFQNTQIVVKRSASIKLPIPKFSPRHHDTKFVPGGVSRFIVSFENGDYTKPKVTEELFDDVSISKEE